MHLPKKPRKSFSYYTVLISVDICKINVWYFPSGYAGIITRILTRYKWLSIIIRIYRDHSCTYNAGHYSFTTCTLAVPALPRCGCSARHRLPQASPQNPLPSIPHAFSRRSLLTPKSPTQTPAKGSFSHVTRQSRSPGVAAPANPDPAAAGPGTARRQ